MHLGFSESALRALSGYRRQPWTMFKEDRLFIIGRYAAGTDGLSPVLKWMYGHPLLRVEMTHDEADEVAGAERPQNWHPHLLSTDMDMRRWVVTRLLTRRKVEPDRPAHFQARSSGSCRIPSHRIDKIVKLLNKKIIQKI